ncbi:hypothetical protein K7I13_09320 [Brucepastera parasyntrophica]|uniref:hypothetical protein n=1 Tax=Brucepastera parasyntrophica TaxID=2880008 RepID=UPI00210DA80A|nr:hypothetical protein [Brucepastera parasyntrophica]ULQ58750.1 hypothetical protein K7I13_09320 [Brucepastera parasyntrophica]
MKNKDNRLVFILIFTLIFTLSAQETIPAEKEYLSSIELGEENDKVYYFASGEGFYSPGGIRVDDQRRLIFIPTWTWDHLLIYEKGKWSSKPLPPVCLITGGVTLKHPVFPSRAIREEEKGVPITVYWMTESNTGTVTLEI